MNYAELSKCIRIGPASLAGNQNAEYLIRIEAWKDRGSGRFFASVQLGVHCDVRVLGEENNSTEFLWSEEESLGRGESCFEYEDEAIKHAVTSLSTIFELGDATEL